jgi:Bax protein
MKSKNLNLFKIKKILLKKVYRIQKNSSLINLKPFKSLTYTIFASIVLIFSFGIMPSIISISSKFFSSPLIVENNSKLNFEKVLDGKEIDLNNEDESDKLRVTELFLDIFEFESVPDNTVRFSASTLEEIYKDNGFNLNEIRNNKIVKPVKIDLLPKEIKKIENTKKRKNLFIQIVLPLILEENTRIKLERKKLFTVLNKNNNTESEIKWLRSKFKQYGVVNRDLTTLKIRMDEIPVSLAIAQAAKETGWGTSRFALEGNALFGQWTFSGEGIKPKGADIGDTHKVMKFKVLQASVRAYQRNLNTHSSYRQFRKMRAIQRDNLGTLNSLELVNYLDKYAETGKEYTKILKKIIEQNNLTDFDDAKLLPSSQKMKKII